MADQVDRLLEYENEHGYVRARLTRQARKGGSRRTPIASGYRSCWDVSQEGDQSMLTDAPLLIGCGFARGITQLLAWTCGAAATGPVTGEPAPRPPSLCQVSLEVRRAMAGLRHARRVRSPVLTGRMEGIMETCLWLAGWNTAPLQDTEGDLAAVVPLSDKSQSGNRDRHLGRLAVREPGPDRILVDMAGRVGQRQVRVVDLRAGFEPVASDFP
jgi:hypothetical protein